MYISDGNSKMTFPTWSLPSKKTCPGSTATCRKQCYAHAAEVQYPRVLPCRLRNLKASRSKGFVVDMASAIKRRRKVTFFRIHESGDFYSQKYLNSWFDICRLLPKTRFLTFTKSYDLDYSKCPKNLVIMFSVFPDTDLSKVPSGPRAYAGAMSKRRRTIECPGNCDSCGMCWDIHTAAADVHFAIHGSGLYKRN